MCVCVVEAKLVAQQVCTIGLGTAIFHRLVSGYCVRHCIRRYSLLIALTKVLLGGLGQARLLSAAQACALQLALAVRPSGKQTAELQDLHDLQILWICRFTGFPRPNCCVLLVSVLSFDVDSRHP